MSLSQAGGTFPDACYQCIAEKGDLTHLQEWARACKETAVAVASQIHSGLLLSEIEYSGPQHLGLSRLMALWTTVIADHFIAADNAKSTR